MRQGEIYEQIGGGTRYTYTCPRGTVAIDVSPDGRREVIRCCGGSRLTTRDVREALRRHADAHEEG